MLRRYTPGQIWQISLVYQCLILDKTQKLVDPEVKQAFRIEMKRYYKNNGNDYWWEPGEALPG